MNRALIAFFCGTLITLITQAVQNDPMPFESSHSLAFNDLIVDEVDSFFPGNQWVENKVTSDVVDLNNIYQQKAFTKKLSNDSTVRRYQKSYGTWIEERICPESPYIDKPVRSRITSRYGRRYHPMSGRYHVHAGIDFRGNTGTPVYAASPGIVKSAKRKGAYGKAIIIDHGNSFTTLYAHLSGYSVKDGQWVHQGQTIGYIGRTGRATGPHLHFEVRCNNVPLNPRQFLGKMGQTAEVRFKRKYRSYLAHNHAPLKRKPAARKKVAVKRDPNYYTRMINLQKLQKLKSKKN